jgi:hypothetical protein
VEGIVQLRGRNCVKVEGIVQRGKICAVEDISSYLIEL